MKKNKILAVIFAVGCVAAIGIASVLVVFAKNNFGDDKLICRGIKIGSLDVGGMTEEEAGAKVSDFISSQLQKKVLIQVQEHQIEATVQELGVAYEDKAFAKEALAIGKKGNLWKRFQELRKAESGHRNIDMSPVVDRQTLKNFVETKCSAFDIKAKDSKLKYKNGKLRATKSREGLEVQVEKTMQLLEDTVLEEDAGELDTLEISAEVEVTEPKYTQEEVSQCTDLLGKYSTTYSTYQVERSSNVATAAGRINGTVVYPGKVFSTVKVIKDRTEENGYKSAPEYSSGKVVSGIGGGVCQVSTTLYNAVINAELEVVERSPHSMVVAYVPVSRDAAISGDYKDFKFKNNLDYPIYIMGSASGGVLTFRVYGHETRAPGREISFDSEITDTIEPGNEVVTEDPSLPADYRSVTQSAHVGYRAKLWKIVKEDGVETERILVNSSAYNPSPQYVTVGKQTPSPTPEDTSKPKKSPGAKDKDKKGGKSGTSGNSGSSGKSNASGSGGSSGKSNTSGGSSGKPGASGSEGSPGQTNVPDNAGTE